MNTPTVKKHTRLAALVLALGATTRLCEAARETILLDDGWFWTGANSEANTPALPDARAQWKPVTIPHDWSIEGRTGILQASGNNGGFFPTGSAWYCRDLILDPSWAGQQVELRFDGIYSEAEVWLDGKKVAEHAYGYTPLTVVLDPVTKKEAPRRLAVRVNNSQQPNSRWYGGSGIYRHVWLTIKPPVCIAAFGVKTRTMQLKGEEAVLEVATRVQNKEKADREMVLKHSLRDPSGAVLGTGELKLVVPAGSEAEGRLEINLSGVKAWSPEQPSLNTLSTQLCVAGSKAACADEVSTVVGLRTVEVSAEKGFLLNGQRIVLNGGNLHHDNGALGAVALDRAEERKVELLKAAGFTAVRTAHNPPSPAFLEACDRLGLLVMDEAFDGWAKHKTAKDYGTHFKKWWKEDLQAMVRRDWNHPSVVIWSIGNEVYERGTEQGRALAAELRAGIHELDTSRPITAGINDVPGNWKATDGVFSSLDLAGYNYETARHEEDHKRLPERVIVLTESYQNEAYKNFKVCRDNPYVVGDFVWSATDYLGEAGIGRVYMPGETPVDHWVADQFPWHGAVCGDIDITGWRKPSSHWRAVVWGHESLYAAVRMPTPSGKPWALTKWSMPPALPTWSWAGKEGKAVQIEIYSREAKVRAYVNGTLAGEAEAGEKNECRAVIETLYEPGTLSIESLNEAGAVVERRVLESAGPVAQLKLSADRTEMKADAQDLLYVTVELTDEAGRWQPQTDLPIRYEVEGPALIAGIGSGDLSSQEAYFDNPRRSWQGRALVILRSTGAPGTVTLRALAPGLQPAVVSGTVVPGVR